MLQILVQPNINPIIHRILRKTNHLQSLGKVLFRRKVAARKRMLNSQRYSQIGPRFSSEQLSPFIFRLLVLLLDLAPRWEAGQKFGWEACVCQLLLLGNLDGLCCLDMCDDLFDEFEDVVGVLVEASEFVHDVCVDH